MPSYSGLYDGVYGTPHSKLDQSIAKGNDVVSLARITANKLYGRASTRALIIALLGAATGQTASASHTRVKANADRENNVQGGLRDLETFVAINRVTTSDDVDQYEEAFELDPQPTYVSDKSGVGGGGKLGY